MTKPTLYLADCDDLGLFKELDEEGLEYKVERRYYYPTGADHPGLWMVLTFVGMSILSGYTHDAFKKFLTIIGKHAKKQNKNWNDDGPFHHGLVLESGEL